MHLIEWLFEVLPEKQELFEAVYAGDGDWAALFRQSPDFMGTSLFQDQADPTRYLTLDCWRSRAAFERFHASHHQEYIALDNTCLALTIREMPVGTIETDSIEILPNVPNPSLPLHREKQSTDHQRQRINIRPIGREDQDWIRAFIAGHWGAEFVVAHGVVYYPHQLPGFIAETESGSTAGLATYTIRQDACELVTIDAEPPGAGVGSAMLGAVETAAREAGCTRLWLITANDNLEALAFYQKRGFCLVAVHRDALARSRQLKPSIPLIGAHGIPLRDEIELELRLS